LFCLEWSNCLVQLLVFLQQSLMAGWPVLLAVFLLQRCHLGEYIYAFVLEYPGRIEMIDAEHIQRDVSRQSLNGERVSDGETDEDQTANHFQPGSQRVLIVQQSQTGERSQNEDSVHDKLALLQHLVVFDENATSQRQEYSVNEGVKRHVERQRATKLFSLNFFRQLFVVTQPRCSWEPAGTVENSSQLVSDSINRLDLLVHLPPVIEFQVKRIEEIDLADQTVNHRFFPSFGGECSENAIPDDKDAGVVFVNAISRGTMVNAVVTGGIEHPFQRSHIVNELRVKPKLPQQIKLNVRGEMTGRNEESQRQDPWKTPWRIAVAMLYSSEL